MREGRREGAGIDKLLLKNSIKDADVLKTCHIEEEHSEFKL